MSDRTFTYDSFIRLSKNRVAMLALFFLLFLALIAIIGPSLSPYPYYQTHLALKNSPPSAIFWMGSDDLGRSIFSRILYGARISLFIGVTAAFIDMVIGVVYGAISGFLGGKADEWMMRIADIFHSLPRLIIVIMLMVVLGQGIFTIILSMTLTGWINMARIIRGQILQLKQEEFVLASKVIGASSLRILSYHLIPNTLGSIITTMTLTIPSAIFTEAFLSFLGLGVPPPEASWGTMAADGLASFRYYPWRLFFPSFFISITLLAFNLLGDGMRDAFDPRMRE
jgi:oligopeptide transport system permease protein